MLDEFSSRRNQLSTNTPDSFLEFEMNAIVALLLPIAQRDKTRPVPDVVPRAEEAMVPATQSDMLMETIATR